ncbi:unnamed protein product, partial [Mesorhabditis spiculigera]
MPAYNSHMDSKQSIGNMALHPLRTTFKGPAPQTQDEDIIDEALTYFKANVFFRHFEIKSSSDRTLLFITLYTTECLRKLQNSPNKAQGLKDLHVLALSNVVPIPGEAAFPLNSFFHSPKDKNEEEVMRAYLQQIKQEVGLRLCELAFPVPNERASKWWLCFSKRRFLNKYLISPGVTI